jgi:hypothetical protein
LPVRYVEEELDVWKDEENRDEVDDAGYTCGSDGEDDGFGNLDVEEPSQ